MFSITLYSNMKEFHQCQRILVLFSAKLMQFVQIWLHYKDLAEKISMSITTIGQTLIEDIILDNNTLFDNFSCHHKAETQQLVFFLGDAKKEINEKRRMPFLPNIIQDTAQISSIRKGFRKKGKTFEIVRGEGRGRSEAMSKPS